MPGILYLVATPIGNLEDMTFRAVRVLKEVDLVVYEERKEGGRLLRHFGVEKPVESLNEHNELAASSVILGRLKDGKSVALISDAGTPVFSDPGQLLVEKAILAGVTVVPIPGASSLLPALIVSGFPINRFLFYGFLSPKRNRRITELQQLRKEPRTIVVMETPYRLLQLVRDIAEVFGESRRICVALDLTLPTEEIMRGTGPELYRRLSRDEKKGEFVVVIEGQGK
ncbi:MAG: 16S rRNA (cytidine(1402)-2'-O)-methyltransferase [Ignavibacteriales bacterium]|nr:16S rRNA (cytidine(1402)-2'-O)-methyltransferase [Ignavibacteriales bacterium]